MNSPIVIRLGRRARERIAERGLSARDIAVIPAAAGGPKGLILHSIDCWLFGDYLPSQPRPRQLVGASIGAWRMAAAAFDDPVAAQRRLVRLYVDQQYPPKVDAAYVSRTCRALLDALLDGRDQEVLASENYRLSILTARGAGRLAAASGGSVKAGFLHAALMNLAGRHLLAASMERVIFHNHAVAASHWLDAPFDAFRGHRVALAERNLRDALLASGSIPLVLDAVRDIAGAPPGSYWDGGLVDYHLHLPYQRDPDLVLYPHFADHIIPGWLDKAMPWRRARAGDPALENMILVAPSPAFLATLPNGKMPDRRDFKVYGTDNAGRQRDWRRAIAESERMAEALARWCAVPDLDMAGDL
jgi:hypothetical protein